MSNIGNYEFSNECRLAESENPVSYKDFMQKFNSDKRNLITLLSERVRSVLRLIKEIATINPKTDCIIIKIGKQDINSYFAHDLEFATCALIMWPNAARLYNSKCNNDLPKFDCIYSAEYQALGSLEFEASLLHTIATPKEMRFFEKAYNALLPMTWQSVQQMFIDAFNSGEHSVIINVENEDAPL